MFSLGRSSLAGLVVRRPKRTPHGCATRRGIYDPPLPDVVTGDAAVNQYRALYISPAGARRGITFAAVDAHTAGVVAEGWAVPGWKLLTVNFLRMLQSELTLEGS